MYKGAYQAPQNGVSLVSPSFIGESRLPLFARLSSIDAEQTALPTSDEEQVRPSVRKHRRSHSEPDITGEIEPSQEAADGEHLFHRSANGVFAKAMVMDSASSVGAEKNHGGQSLAAGSLRSTNSILPSIVDCTPDSAAYPNGMNHFPQRLTNQKEVTGYAFGGVSSSIQGIDMLGVNRVSGQAPAEEFSNDSGMETWKHANFHARLAQDPGPFWRRHSHQRLSGTFSAFSPSHISGCVHDAEMSGRVNKGPSQPPADGFFCDAPDGFFCDAHEEASKHASLQARKLDESILMLVSADPGCFQRMLADAKLPCVRKQPACRACTLLAEAGYASELLETGIMVQLVRQLKCSDACCRADSLEAIRSLLVHTSTGLPERHGPTAPKRGVALRLLSAFSKSGAGKQSALGAALEFAVEAKGAKVLLNLLCDASETSANLQAGLSVLRFLAVRYGGATLVPKQEAIQAVLGVLHKFTDIANMQCGPLITKHLDLGLLSAALHALNALLAGQVLSASSVADDAALQPIIYILKYGDAELAALAADVLLHLAHTSDGLKMTIARSGVFRAAGRLLESPASCLSMMHLLRAVASHESLKLFFVRSGLIAPVVRLMGECREHGVVTAAGQLLTELAVNNRACQNIIAASGAIRIFVDLLSSQDSEQQIMAASGLLALVHSNAANRRSVVRLDAEQKLLRMMHKSQNAICQQTVTVLLAQLRIV